MIKKLLIVFFLNIFINFNSFASNLTEDAIQRGINDKCVNYLRQLEEKYSLNGLNITFAHPQSPSFFPSLHISSIKFNNGATTFSATLLPIEDYCFLSTVLTTSVNDKSCNQIAEIKLSSDSNLKFSSFAEGGYMVITPPDNSFQTILTSAGSNSCTINEARMLWPGK